jgi:hypothetical protein
MAVTDLVFNFLTIHLGEGEVSEDGSQVLSGDKSRLFLIIEIEGVFNLIFHVFRELVI